jgi:uncharacterized protein (TIGR03118 family)
MNPSRRTRPRRLFSARYSAQILAAIVLLVPLAASRAHEDRNSYEQHNLVSDGFAPADHIDKNLVNAWGVVFNPTAFVWVADNHTGVATLYDGAGNPQSLVVNIPGVQANSGHGSPTGIVFNGTNDFGVSNATASGPSRFIFATEEGVIAGWAPNVDLNNALRAAVTANAVYKGLALAANGIGNFLYAANFRAGKIDVFDHAFQPVSMPGGFHDPSIPAGFAPFNIQNIQGDLYVTYAKQDQDKMDEVAGRGLGIVDVFDSNGNLIRRIGTGGQLNAPWGLALAPAEFGKFGNRLLVGNFGDGAILAFDPHHGTFLGRLRNPAGKVLKIDGLWALVFGNGLLGQPTGTLFFSAGPDEENHGLYGTLKPAADGQDRDDDGDD